MEIQIENISIKTYNGEIIDGNAVLAGKNRISEIFTDPEILFINMLDTIDDRGIRKKAIFVNKNLIIWVKPRDRKATNNQNYIDKTRYGGLSIKTIEGVIIDGKINMKDYKDMNELLVAESEMPFLVIKDAHDNNDNFHHVLFINKKSVVMIEETINL